MTENKRKIAYWTPALLIGLFLSTVLYLYFTEATFFKMGSLMLGVLVLCALAVWYFFAARCSWKKRLQFFAVGLFVLLGAAALFRYEGSLDGSAFPKFVLRWGQPEEDADMLSLQEAPSESGAEALLEEDAPSLAGAADFPQFLGPLRTGVLPDISLETDWKQHPPRELWRDRIGLGWAGFAVVGRRALTLEQRKEEEWVACYDLLTGALLWAHASKARFSEAMGGVGPRSTPAVQDGRVYAMGATGILVCLDLKTGRLHWKRSVLEENGAANIEWGKSTSPLLVGDAVIVSGGEKGPTLLAYSKETGEPLWKAGEDRAGYSSPVLGVLSGVSQILNVSASQVAAHNPDTGAILWKCPWPGTFPKSSQPQVLSGDRVFVSASYNMHSMLLQVERAGDAWSVRKIWKANRMKTKFSSPVLYKGHAYGMDEARLACIDIQTGERKWKGEKYGYGQLLLAGDGVLLIQAEPGFLALVRAAPDECRELARLDALSGKTWNIPTLAGKYLLVRNDKEMVCYELPLRGGQ